MTDPNAMNDDGDLFEAKQHTPHAVSVEVKYKTEFLELIVKDCEEYALYVPMSFKGSRDEVGNMITQLIGELRAMGEMVW